MNKELLVSEMAKRSITESSLAELASVDRTTIWRILHEEDRSCSVAVAARIVNSMKLSPKIATEIFFRD